ncbi:hypothetical protein ACC771_06445, partial [Rhizobium ruizarguesonis]
YRGAGRPSPLAQLPLDSILPALELRRPVILETTALGAAWLAGSRAGVWPDRDGFSATWKRDRRFEPDMDEKVRAAKLKGWKNAVKRTLSEG